MTAKDVLLVIPGLDLGGSERQVAVLACGLASRGWRVAVMTFRVGNPELEDALALAGVNRIVLPRSNPLSALFSAARYCSANRVVLVQAFLASAQVFAMILKLLCPGMKLIVAVRDTLPLFYHRGIPERIYDVAIFCWKRGVDSFVFNSVQGVRAKEQNPDDSSVIVIPNGIDGGRFIPALGARMKLRESLGIAPAETVVGVAANVTAYKGFHNLIEAGVLLRKWGAKVRFVVLGAGSGAYSDEIRSLAKSSCPEGFFFLGRAEKVEEMMAGFDFVCSPSHTEGFSNSIAEAMSCGIPCVATSVGESREIVGKTGWIVPPQDSEALAKAIMMAVATDADERRSRGEAARERIKECFSVDRMLLAHSDLYARLLSSL